MRGMTIIKNVNMLGVKLSNITLNDGANTVIDAEGRIAFPSFFDMHVHLENALSLKETGENDSGTLNEAVERWAKIRDSLSVEELKNRIKKAIILEIFNGVTHVRNHADTCSKNINSVKASLEVKEEMKDFVDIQVVAFPEQGIFNCNEDEFKRAAEISDIIGGKPDGEDNEDLGKKHLELISSLSLKLNKSIDSHIDQGDEPTRFSEYLLGLRNGHIALSHLTSIHSDNDEYVSRLIRLIKKRNASVISSPLTTVFLNGRFDKYPKRRGLTRIKQLLSEGVNVALGHDDFQNPFFPFGFGDIIQALWLAVLMEQANLKDAEAWIDLITRNAEIEWTLSTSFKPSEDIVILDAKSLREQLSTLSTRFMVIRKGKIIAYSNRSGEVFLNDSKINPYDLIA
ncbi:amidohydrolase family protein [Acidianus ambivalens]|uniref:Amidohydrolase family protein n=2 Tax=Acidianus ambivalens TaxID=2283 RepID=A0A650CWH5_ACIAM|nr:amidohydrolase family protein [Acidianus ambivalens]QGR22229.1 amidohydrolase family protein [Acidianus ambivalens]